MIADGAGDCLGCGADEADGVQELVGLDLAEHADAADGVAYLARHIVDGRGDRAQANFVFAVFHGVALLADAGELGGELLRRGEGVGRVGLELGVREDAAALGRGAVGQKQLALLARTFVAKRKLLLLDEPESALDFRLRYQIMNLLCSYVERNHAVSLVTLHDSSLALNYCNTLLVLSESKLIGEVYPDKTPIEEMEMLLSKVYGTISIRELRNRQGKRQLVMMKEDDMN